jgi:hypothetical protein
MPLIDHYKHSENTPSCYMAKLCAYPHTYTNACIDCLCFKYHVYRLTSKIYLQLSFSCGMGAYTSLQFFIINCVKV